MRVPLLDLAAEYHSLARPIREKIDSVLATQQFILGPQVEEFEAAICRFTGAPHAIGMSSGTDALLAVLMALEFGPNDAILTTPYSFFATASSAARACTTPFFADIEPDTFNISVAAIERFLDNECERSSSGGLLHRKSGKRLRAIMPVHLFGLPCDMQKICEIAGRHDLLVIEDAAQAIGAECRVNDQVRSAGTIGDVGCFSFYPSKNLGAAGDAGLVVCRDEGLAKKLRTCRQHGMEPRYFHHFIGGNFRLDEIQAAVLSAKLPHLDEWSAARGRVADVYRQEFSRADLAERIALPAEPYRDDQALKHHHIYHQFVIRAAQRDELRDYLAQREIGTAIYYPLALHQQECFRYLGYNTGDFPEAERAARETLALPMFPTLTQEAQRYVVEAVAEFYSR